MSTTPPTEGTAKKSRAPRKDYGYDLTATIKLIRDPNGDSPSYRGNRKDWYERIAKSDGSTVAEFMKINAGKDSPRGWLRYFANEKKIKLVKKEG